MEAAKYVWEELRPSRLSVLGVYAKRAIRWRSNNAPYLSGDLFADNSDVSIYEPRFRSLKPSIKEIREARVIFCPSNRLQEFLDEHSSELQVKVIIAGNSDFEFHSLPRNLPKGIKQLFLQNSFVSDHPLVTTLPIGIENFRYGVNGNPKYINEGPKWYARQNKILVGPFGLTHKDRYRVREDFMDSPPQILFIAQRCSPLEFDSLMNSCRYVAAVRGNGVDTHRLWEALYRGCIPIVKKDKWSTSLLGLNLPLELIDEWSRPEVSKVISTNVDRTFSPRMLDAIWWPYWKRLINNHL